MGLKFDAPKTLEEAQAIIIKLQEEEKNLETNVATLTEKDKLAAQRITELQEHNQKLFLKITQDPTKPEGDKPKAKSLSELTEAFKDKI